MLTSGLKGLSCYCTFGKTVTVTKHLQCIQHADLGRVKNTRIHIRLDLLIAVQRRYRKNTLLFNFIQGLKCYFSLFSGI